MIKILALITLLTMTLGCGSSVYGSYGSGGGAVGGSKSVVVWAAPEAATP